MRSLLLSKLLIFTPLFWSSLVGSASVLTELSNGKYSALHTIFADADQAKLVLRKQYFDALHQAREESGELGFDGRVEALEAEIRALALRQSTSSESVVDGELARLRECYEGQFELIELQEAKKIVKWQSDYSASLEYMKEVALKLDDETETKEIEAELASVAEEPEIIEALALVKAAKEKGISAEVLSFESDWTSLVGLDCDAKGGKYFARALEREDDWVRKYKGVGYDKSQILYSHSPGKYTFHFSEPIDGFKSTACIETRSRKGNVVFTIETDAEGEIYRSEAIRSGRRGEEIEIGFKPAKTLILTVHPNGGGAEDWAFWLKPSVSFDSASSK